MAAGVVAEDPASVPAQMVLIADRLTAGAPAEALALADAALAEAPADASLHLVRLSALETLGDTEGAGAELTRMAELFPDRRGRAPGADPVAPPERRRGRRRGGAAQGGGRTAPDDPEPALTVVQFLLELEGAEAARAELDARIAAATRRRRRPPALPARAGRARLRAGPHRGGHRRADAAHRGRRPLRRACATSRPRSPRCRPRPATPPPPRRSSPACSRPTRRMWRR